MAFLSQREMRELGSRVLSRQQTFGKTARTVFAEATGFEPGKKYNIFLSHSSRDKALVLGVKSRLEEDEFAVYVDWIDDRDLDRTAVTPENANRLRQRMNRCDSLLYLATDNAALLTCPQLSFT